MRQREDETTIGFEQLGEGEQEGFNGYHIHHGHVADGGIKASFVQAEQLLLAGGVNEFVLDAVDVLCIVFSSLFKHLCAEIGSDDVCAKGSHAPREDTVT